MNRYNLENGAKQAIDRVCKAYGFTSRVRLAEYLGINPSSLGNRIARDNYPHDLILKCALETKASLEWLATGEGAPEVANDQAGVSIKELKIDESESRVPETYLLDKKLLPHTYGELRIVDDGNSKFIVELGERPVQDGTFLIEFSGIKRVANILIIPGDFLALDWDSQKHRAQCHLQDVKILGQVFGYYTPTKK
ncbi:phage repressor protein CI [Mixta calida]|uniref:phage repressor protein CI n=1 Tax=Mixta calida TaxID=665913 RepID=UPI0029072B68|nr:phage repressor protein CI [Mixta calida]MDU6416459.1 phage repressor protein CI [Mixta calida]